MGHIHKNVHLYGKVSSTVLECYSTHTRYIHPEGWYMDMYAILLKSFGAWPLKLFGHLNYVHMYSTNVRSVNVIFWVPMISIGVFTCMRFASSNGPFAFLFFFGQGAKKSHPNANFH